jgi:hypothetical protein
MKQKITVYTLSLSLLVFLFSNCGNNEKGEVITAQKFDSLKMDPSNDGKRYSLIGYPSVKGDITVFAENEGSMFLTSEPNGEGETIALINLKMGTGSNEMYIPDKFTNDDLRVYDNEGNELTTKDKIQVSFTVDMDTKREPVSQIKTSVEGTKVTTKQVMEYYGQGPTDFRIDKVE